MSKKNPKMESGTGEYEPSSRRGDKCGAVRRNIKGKGKIKESARRNGKNTRKRHGDSRLSTILKTVKG